jgi:hypothetical protein
MITRLFLGINLGINNTKLNSKFRFFHFFVIELLNFDIFCCLFLFILLNFMSVFIIHITVQVLEIKLQVFKRYILGFVFLFGQIFILKPKRRNIIIFQKKGGFLYLRKKMYIFTINLKYFKILSCR